MGIVRCWLETSAIADHAHGGRVLLGDSKQPRGKGGHLFFTCSLQANGSPRLQDLDGGGRKSTPNAARILFSAAGAQLRTINRQTTTNDENQFPDQAPPEGQKSCWDSKQPRERGCHLFSPVLYRTARGPTARENARPRVPWDGIPFLPTSVGKPTVFRLNIPGSTVPVLATNNLQWSARSVGSDLTTKPHFLKPAPPKTPTASRRPYPL